MSFFVVLIQIALMVAAGFFVKWHIIPAKLLPARARRADIMNRLVPNYCGISAGIMLVYLSFYFPNDELLPIKEVFNSAKANIFLSVIIGVISCAILLFLESDKSRTNPAISSTGLLFATIIFVPVFYIDWTSAPAAAGTFGKLVATGVAFSIKGLPSVRRALHPSQPSGTRPTQVPKPVRGGRPTPQKAQGAVKSRQRIKPRKGP